jgi:hypothetical protein
MCMIRIPWEPTRVHTAALTLFLIVFVGACGNGAPADDGEPRVFFEQPRDGEVLTGTVEVVFGSQNIEIGAIPDEFDQPREGVVHYHLGYNTDCLPPGTVIPEADPWIHFGDGTNEIEMPLPPGEYRLTVQAGDDEHRTLEGLCETIEITVEPN